MVDCCLSRFGFCFAVLAALFLLSAAVSAPLVFAQGDAAAAIASAKQEIAACTAAMRAAEGAGGNVTDLAAVLNDAGLLLTDAEFAYSQGDFGAARNLATQCQNGLSGFVDEAAQVRAAGEQARSLDFMVNVVGSGVGTFLVIGAGFGVWVLLKRRDPKAEDESVAVA